MLPFRLLPFSDCDAKAIVASSSSVDTSFVVCSSIVANAVTYSAFQKCWRTFYECVVFNDNFNRIKNALDRPVLRKEIFYLPMKMSL